MTCSSRLMLVLIKTIFRLLNNAESKTPRQTRIRPFRHLSTCARDTNTTFTSLSMRFMFMTMGFSRNLWDG